ncbi:TolC family protein [Psychroflexus montanilacus]|uniref:TolC family protein n=1 Tax=Psychroflexus montanilacus TaxID=2873598 RepID=UPI001CCE1EC7|nr:TolC family protein [Psychroflexus montanilacus]MBZ9650948.1 TolC family protein [Psychroflexus montanilacus]
MLKYLFGFILLLIQFNGFSQDTTIELNLNTALAIALENNLDVKSSNLRAETSDVEFRQARNSRLPNLNGNYNFGLNNGRSIDPFTNTFIEEELTFSNAGLALEATIFNGFQIKNRIQRDRFNLKAAEAEVEQAKQEMVLNVTLAYFQILNNKDLLRLAKARRTSTKEQLERLQDLNEEGQGNPANYTDIRGQLANDNSIIADAENSLKASKLELIRLLNIDTKINVTINQFKNEPVEYEFSADQVFDESQDNLASFKAEEFRIKAAEEDIQVTRSLYALEISFFAQLNTNFSSLATLFNETGTQVVETSQFVSIGNDNFPVLSEQTNFIEERIPYQDQLINNLNSNLGISLRIPIFNGFRAKNTVALQKIVLDERKVNYQRIVNEFKQAIQEAHNDMQTAHEKYIIFKEQVEAYSESFRVNEIRFNSGVSNIVEYIISKNNLDNAKINLANARYEYIFRTKILDYYRGIS